MKPLGRVPALDGVRGVAILLVLGWHADGLLPGGSLGVNLFFVLSGFLITSLLIDEHHATGHLSLRSFYRRRALRLLPALVFAVAVAFAVILVTDPGRFTRGLWSIPMIATFTVNMPFAKELVPGELGQLWSLSQEEQFYVLWPPILAVLLIHRASPRIIAAALVGLAALAVAWRTGLVYSTSGHPGKFWYRPDTNAESLLLGCATAFCVSHGFIRRVPHAVSIVLLAYAALIVALITWGTVEFFNALPVFAVASAIVIARIVIEPDWWFSRLMAVAPLRALGRVSYALYMLHLPFVLWLGWQAGMPIAVLLAAFSYRYVEAPFLRRKRRWSPAAAVSPARRPRPVVAVEQTS